MRSGVASVLVLLVAPILAGCAAPEAVPTPEPEGPIVIPPRPALYLVDVEARAVSKVAEGSILAWMSPSGTLVTWSEATFSVVVDTTTGVRQVANTIVWARVHDNGTGLELAPGEARTKALANGTLLHATPLPPAPVEGRAWTQASEDLGLLGAEYATGLSGCRNELYLRAGERERTLGCHLRIAADGRAGWTEGDAVRVRAPDGTIENLTSTERVENPVFTDEGVLMLRVTGAPATFTEIVDEDGEAIATLAGPRKLALHDASADGRFVLVRAFD